MSNNFHRDGHGLALALAEGEVTMTLTCPHDGQPAPKYEDTPECRRMHCTDPQTGPYFVCQPSCLVQANYDGRYPGQHFVHDDMDFRQPFHVRQVPLAVEWAMVNEGPHHALYLRPYYRSGKLKTAEELIDAYRQYADLSITVHDGKVADQDEPCVRIGDVDIELLTGAPLYAFRAGHRRWARVNETLFRADNNGAVVAFDLILARYTTVTDLELLPATAPVEEVPA